jgi:hypothetical protein
LATNGGSISRQVEHQREAQVAAPMLLEDKTEEMTSMYSIRRDLEGGKQQYQGLKRGVGQKLHEILMTAIREPCRPTCCRDLLLTCILNDVATSMNSNG